MERNRPATDKATSIPLVEETLEAHVVPKERGMVRIRKHAMTEPVQIDVDLHQRDVTVERLVRNEVVVDRQEPWNEDGALMIPVYEEEVVTEIRLILREVIRVQQVDRTEHVTLEGDVRRDIVDVERTDQ